MTTKKTTNTTAAKAARTLVAGVLASTLALGMSAAPALAFDDSWAPDFGDIIDEVDPTRPGSIYDVGIDFGHDPIPDGVVESARAYFGLGTTSVINTNCHRGDYDGIDCYQVTFITGGWVHNDNVPEFRTETHIAWVDGDTLSVLGSTCY